MTSYLRKRLCPWIALSTELMRLWTCNLWMKLAVAFLHTWCEREYISLFLQELITICESEMIQNRTMTYCELFDQIEVKENWEKILLIQKWPYACHTNKVSNTCQSKWDKMLVIQKGTIYVSYKRVKYLSEQMGQNACHNKRIK